MVMGLWMALDGTATAIRRSQGPPFDENAFLKGLEALSQSEDQKVGHKVAGLAQHFNHFLRQGKKRRAKQRQRPEQTSPASFGASKLRVEGVSPSNGNPRRRKKVQQREVQGIGIAGSESRCKDLFGTWVWARNEVPVDRMEAQDWSFFIIFQYHSLNFTRTHQHLNGQACRTRAKK